jgi:hypothetical protein
VADGTIDKAMNTGVYKSSSRVVKTTYTNRILPATACRVCRRSRRCAAEDRKRFVSEFKVVHGRRSVPRCAIYFKLGNRHRRPPPSQGRVGVPHRTYGTKGESRYGTEPLPHHGARSIYKKITSFTHPHGAGACPAASTGCPSPFSDHLRQQKHNK